MTRTSYEIHLRGHLDPQAAEELHIPTRLEAPAETVLLTERIDQAGVHELIDRLKDLGIELLELRQCADDYVSGSDNA
jgi:hypothetical protein